ERTSEADGDLSADDRELRIVGAGVVVVLLRPLIDELGGGVAGDPVTDRALDPSHVPVPGVIDAGGVRDLAEALDVVAAGDIGAGRHRVLELGVSTLHVEVADGGR